MTNLCTADTCPLIFTSIYYRVRVLVCKRACMCVCLYICARWTHSRTHTRTHICIIHTCLHQWCSRFSGICLFEAKSSTFSAKLGTLIPQNRLKFVQDLPESNVVVNLIDELWHYPLPMHYSCDLQKLLKFQVVDEHLHCTLYFPNSSMGVNRGDIFLLF